MSLPMPKKVPKDGFYYHYKHDRKGPVNNYAYEFIAVGFHTEKNCRPSERHFVLYQPLYEKASVYRASQKLKVQCFDTRPLKMWMGKVRNKKGKWVPRFRRIREPGVVMRLQKISDEMY